MSLADELLADLDGADQDVEMSDEVDLAEVAEVKDYPLTPGDHQSIYSIAKMRDSDILQNLLKQIDFFTNQPKREIIGTVEADPEYKLIVDANNIAMDIDNEIHLVHKFVRDIYNIRFPELESLVQQPLDYMKTVLELGNNIENSKNSRVLQEILSPATIMVVSVSASTTQGEELQSGDSSRIVEACELAIDLERIRSHIYEYVEKRMSFVAPNLTAIVGASTAAKLMGAAGGLENLGKIPSCNVLLIGAQKKTLSGFSTMATLPHTGFIYYSELVQSTPHEFRRKIADLAANKCALAARIDCSHEHQSGSHGQALRMEIIQKLEKLQEPPPIKQIKALPAPIDVARKKRGGRRLRKLKERLGMTEMRKAANRMNFGEIEEDAYQDDLGLTLGNLGKNKSGNVRAHVIDSKTKVRISKTLQQKIQKQQVWGGTTTVKKQISGTASSVAFTPLQGLEIVNPQAAQIRESSANSKYFSSASSFIHVNK